MADPAEQLPKPDVPQAPKPLAQAFQTQRNQALQAANQGAQQGQDALQRRLTAMGQLNSGVGIQAQQEQQAQSNMQRQQATAGIDQQEAQVNAQSEEAQKQRDFQGDQNKMQQDYQNKVLDLDRQVKLGQLSMAQAEAQRDAITTEFNKAVTAREQGFGVDLRPLLDQSYLAKSYGAQGNDTMAGRVANGNLYEGTLPQSQLDAIKRALASQHFGIGGFG